MATSSKTQFIKAIKTKLIAGGIIKTVRGFNGQFDDNRNHPIKYPCALWEFTTIPWQTINDRKGGKSQFTRDAEIIIHVGVRSFGTDPNVDDEVFEIADHVAMIMDKIDADEFGSVYRTDEAMDTQHEHVVDYQITFKFAIADTTTFSKSSGKTATIESIQQSVDIQQQTPDAESITAPPTYGTQ